MVQGMGRPRVRLLCRPTAPGLPFRPELRADDLQVIVPYWFLLIATLLLPVRWTTTAFRARRRRGAGLCRQCNYDLRATPDCCPECGAAVVVQAIQPAIVRKT